MLADAEPRIELLEVDGFGPAVISVPRPRRAPYPLLVVAHGAGDFPEWHCELYARIVRSRGMVLCPRGKPIDAREPLDRAACYYPDHHYLGAVVAASLKAVFRRFPSEATGRRVDPSSIAFAGYSQGASMGALVVGGAPERFTRALLVEGGFKEWNVPIAARYRDGGGHRVAFVCGGIGCALSAGRSAQWLERGGLEARVVYVEGGGHTSFGAVAEALPEVFDWLVADDQRWRRAPPGPPSSRGSPVESGWRSGCVSWTISRGRTYDDDSVPSLGARRPGRHDDPGGSGPGLAKRGGDHHLDPRPQVRSDRDEAGW
ncbi:MAG: hypothetical protein JW751_11215 [Polyangiaceae bacterium]|nr:hypothetical protein [Polyangiaceae bacterium]